MDAMTRAAPLHTGPLPNPCHSVLHSGLRQAQSCEQRNREPLTNPMHPQDDTKETNPVWSGVWEVVSGCLLHAWETVLKMPG